MTDLLTSVVLQVTADSYLSWLVLDVRRYVLLPLLQAQRFAPGRLETRQPLIATKIPLRDLGIHRKKKQIRPRLSWVHDWGLPRKATAKGPLRPLEAPAVGPINYRLFAHAKTVLVNGPYAYVAPASGLCKVIDLLSGKTVATIDTTEPIVGFNSHGQPIHWGGPFEGYKVYDVRTKQWRESPATHYTLRDNKVVGCGSGATNVLFSQHADGTITAPRQFLQVDYRRGDFLPVGQLARPSLGSGHRDPDDYQ